MVSLNNEIPPTMDVVEFINYELKFDLDNLHLPCNEEIVDMFQYRDDAVDVEVEEERESVLIDDVVVEKIGFKDTLNALL